MNAVDIAKQYFKLSNEANLPAIRKLFQPDATYSSDNTGLYLGVDSIMAMMEAFYAKFSSLNWQINKISEPKLGIVEIEFTFEGHDLENNPIQRQGIERIVIADRHIRHIEVRSKMGCNG